MVKVFLYPPNSWEKPTFAEFQITTIHTIVGISKRLKAVIVTQLY